MVEDSKKKSEVDNQEYVRSSHNAILGTSLQSSAKKLRLELEFAKQFIKWQFQTIVHRKVSMVHVHERTLL